MHIIAFNKFVTLKYCFKKFSSNKFELVRKSDIDRYMFISIDIEKSYRFKTHKNKKKSS